MYGLNQSSKSDQTDDSSVCNDGCFKAPAESASWPDCACFPLLLLLLCCFRWAVSVRGWDAHLLCVAAVEMSWSFPSPPGWTGGCGPHKFSKWLAGFCTATSPSSASASTSLFCPYPGTTWSMLYPCHRADLWLCSSKIWIWSNSSCLSCLCSWTRQGFCCLGCLQRLQSPQTNCLCFPWSLFSRKDIISGGFVTCWMLHHFSAALFNRSLTQP